MTEPPPGRAAADGVDAGDDLVLVTGNDPEDLARSVEGALGERLPWVAENDPRAGAATVWFASGRLPASPKTLPALRWIHSAWAGIDRWFERPEWGGDVVLTRTIADMPQRIAEHVFGYLLAGELDVVRAARQQEAKRWERWLPGTLGGKTMLIAGYGAIGRHVASAARAFGLALLAVRRGPVTDDERAMGIETVDALERLLPRADVVVSLLPATAETESFWNAARFGRFAERSTFVNVSRGRIVDDAALLAALARGRPARAILDVFRAEPLPAESPYWSHPRVRVTPHVAGLGTNDTEGRAFAENWRRWRRGEPLQHVVDRARGY